MKSFRLSSFQSISFAFVIFLLMAGSSRAQDTMVVQTLTYDSLSRDGVYKFPDMDGTSYEKVIMQYRMRCHHALVSDGTHTEQGCGQWDYNCETYLWDSTRVDSLKSIFPSAIVSNYPQFTNFPFTNVPTFTTVQRFDQQANYPVGSDIRSHQTQSGGIGTPYSLSHAGSRAIYLIRASELNASGLLAFRPPIAGIQFEHDALPSSLSIRMKLTRDTIVNASMMNDSGFVEVESGANHTVNNVDGFYFYRPFTWDGTSNLLVEFDATNRTTVTDTNIVNPPAAAPTALTAYAESVLSFKGYEGIHIATDDFTQIHNEITISVWTKGDSTILPAQTALLEGTDTKNSRSVNIHLPWDNGDVYWDCGDGVHGFDRISKHAAKPNYSGRWNHWAFTKNAVTGRMNIYLNGVLFSTDTGKHLPIFISKLNLATSLTSTVGYFGAIRKFSIWNKELDPSSIQRIMQNDIQTNDPNYGNLLAYYMLNEGHGNLVTDQSNQHAGGKIIGIPVWRTSHEFYNNISLGRNVPNFTFLQLDGPINPTVTPIPHLDTLIDHAHSITRYAIVGGTVQALDTTYSYFADSSFVVSDSGKRISGRPVSAQDTIRPVALQYYQKSPQKFEIMSFVTPYGIGLDLGKDGKLYEFDVTDYLPIMHGYHRLTMERGAGQEEFDIRFLFIKGRPARDVLDIQQIWPMTEEPYQNILSDLRYEPRMVYLDPLAKGFKLRSMITGHGQQGEFIPRMHHVYVNSTKYEWLVYKICSDNPLYPQGGTWVYNRSGWCPGAPTLETEYELTGTIKPGDSARFDYGVVVDQQGGDSRYDPSNQLVSYGAPNFKTNAGIVNIMRPSDRISYGRINPACDLPLVVIRDNGSDSLVSLNIEYYTDGGPHRKYAWTGKLKFLDTTVVELPVDSLGFWAQDAGKFHVDISQPNGHADEYDQDNHYTSSYSRPPSYVGPLVLNFRTNNNPEQNYYAIRNMKGDSVFQHSGFDPNKTYYDSLMLPPGCYSLIFHDDGEDGLSFFANQGQGSGFLKLRQAKPNKILYTANPDFGKYVQYDFSVVSSLSSVTQPVTRFSRVSIYPNPAHHKLTFIASGYTPQMVTLEIVNTTGNVVKREQRFIDEAGSIRAEIDLRGLAAGPHFLRMTSNSGTSVEPFVIN